jgi:hypothetical protein
MDATRMIVIGLFLALVWPLLAAAALGQAAWAALRRRAAERLF